MMQLGDFRTNPWMSALFPLCWPELPDDILIVSINPLRREAIPQTPMDIQNRIDEISFNAALLGELRAVNFVRRLIADGRIEKGHDERRSRAFHQRQNPDERTVRFNQADAAARPDGPVEGGGAGCRRDLSGQPSRQYRLAQQR